MEASDLMASLKRGRKAGLSLPSLRQQLHSLRQQFETLSSENTHLRNKLKGLEAVVPYRHDQSEFLMQAAAAASGAAAGASAPAGAPTAGCSGPHAGGMDASPASLPEPGPAPAPATAAGAGAGRASITGGEAGLGVVGRGLAASASAASLGGCPSERAAASESTTPGSACAGVLGAGGGGACRARVAAADGAAAAAAAAGAGTGAGGGACCVAAPLRTARSGGAASGSDAEGTAPAGAGAGAGGGGDGGGGGGAGLLLSLCPAVDGAAPAIAPAHMEALKRTTQEEFCELWKHVVAQLGLLVVPAEVFGPGSAQYGRLERFLKAAFRFVARVALLAPACYDTCMSVNLETGRRERLDDASWLAIGHSLALTPPQLAELATLASAYAASVGPVRQQRAALGRQLAATLAGAGPGGGIPMQSRDAVDALTAALQRNLHTEHRTHVDIGDLMTYSVLTPLQVARGLLAAYPYLPTTADVTHMFRLLAV